MKPFRSDVRVNALIEINMQKLNLFPCYEKLGDSLSPSFDRFRATRFQRLLQALKKELQPPLPDSRQLIFHWKKDRINLLNLIRNILKAC